MTRAPKLVMDDGSRVFLDESSASSSHKQTPVDDLLSYFEIERIAGLTQSHTFVAVQFPDTLLSYMAKVLELLQDRHSNGLVFGLNGGCCPDLVTAAHLNATVLVQYGHACFSGEGNASIEIVHGFGQQFFNEKLCVETIKHAKVHRLLVFFSLDYAHSVPGLHRSLIEQTNVSVVVGRIPEPRAPSRTQFVSGQCCASLQAVQATCRCSSVETKGDRCDTNSDTILSPDATCSDERKDDDPQTLESGVATIGGLFFARKDLENFQDSDYSVLYLGSDTNFQFLTIAMRLASRPPSNWFTVNSTSGEVQPLISNKASQLLKTRFYLIQKAKLCHVFGILVADVNRNEVSIQATIQSLQELVRAENHVSYTFVVGSLNPAKLANFGEIDCFIWLACPEHSILQHNSTDYHVPVVTPYELLVAFDRVPWGTYETHASIDESMVLKDKAPDDRDGDSESDAPFFSLVTGTFQQQEQHLEGKIDRLELNDDPKALVGLPGHGVLSTYSSVAAERLKTREYRGLVVNKDAPIVPAIQGRNGIASSYNASDDSSLERR